jgi:hypothetical protein
MIIQRVEIPAKGTPPLAATGHPSIPRHRRSQYSPLSRGFGSVSGRVRLLYPIANLESEKAEERKIEELETPLKEKEEGDHLTAQLQTPPSPQAAEEAILEAAEEAAKKGGAEVIGSSPSPPRKKKRQKLV